LEKSQKITQALGIPYSALLSIVFGMMVLSFPIGAYVVFNTEVGYEITFEFPINGVDVFFGGIGFKIPIGLELGDIFIIFWCIYAILFSIAIIGPKKNFVKTLLPIMSKGKRSNDTNYLVNVIKWFSILVLISGALDLLQQALGITTKPPDVENDLIRFYGISVSPIFEEIGFRVLLIGIPLFAIYSHKSSFSHFFKSLWNPFQNLHIYDSKKPFLLIVGVALLFGLSHIISGEPWSGGKFTLATVSGIIIGWAYYRTGLIPAILIHWATNYFVFSYVYLVSQLTLISVKEAFSHSLITTFEIIFVILGIISATILVVNRYYFKEEKLEV